MNTDEKAILSAILHKHLAAYALGNMSLSAISAPHYLRQLTKVIYSTVRKEVEQIPESDLTLIAERVFSPTDRLSVEDPGKIAVHFVAALGELGAAKASTIHGWRELVSIQRLAYLNWHNHAEYDSGEKRNAYFEAIANQRLSWDRMLDEVDQFLWEQLTIHEREGFSILIRSAKKAAWSPVWRLAEY